MLGVVLITGVQVQECTWGEDWAVDARGLDLLRVDRSLDNDTFRIRDFLINAECISHGVGRTLHNRFHRG